MVVRLFEVPRDEGVVFKKIISQNFAAKNPTLECRSRPEHIKVLIPPTRINQTVSKVENRFSSTAGSA
jgi:hypothetical protein